MKGTASGLLILALVASCSGTSTNSDFTDMDAGGVAALHEQPASTALGPPFCFIGGSIIVSGSIDPYNLCMACQPWLGHYGWTQRPIGTACGVGAVCTGGICAPIPGPGAQTCIINGNVFGFGAEDPTNACRVCTPTASTTTWTNALDGKPCATGSCRAGRCVAPTTSCTVAGAVYLAGDTNPANICEWCAPSRSTTAFSSITDGAACGTGMACFSGVCTASFPDCTIEGVDYRPGAASPRNPCALCQPRQSETTWTNAPDGRRCGPDRICDTGRCTSIFP